MPIFLAVLLIPVSALVLTLLIWVAGLVYEDNALAWLGFFPILLGLLFVVTELALKGQPGPGRVQ